MFDRRKKENATKLKKEIIVNNRSVILLAIAFAVCVAFLGTPAPAAAQDYVYGPSTCSGQAVIVLDSGLYNFQMDEWDSGLEECITTNGVGFTITTADFVNATNGPPATYTSVYRGCHWGVCTSSNPYIFPIQESNLASASSSVSITQPAGSQNDAAYDIWFNQTELTTGQPNGTEVMIWINHQGAPQPFGSQVATATIDGVSWDVWTGRQSSWNVISYVAVAPSTSVTNLNLLPFFSDAISRRSLESAWWLIDVEYGFEIWTGGKGLAATGFSVSAAPKVAPAAKCTVDYTASSTSPSTFQGAITIDNTGAEYLSSWTLTWAFADEQTITDLWNGIETQSGANVKVNSETYNGALYPGGSISSVGFEGTWNGTTNAVPAAISLNGTACTVN
jgi:cellulose 1,4-beta-cellobiosidase